jgi:hypothetical protein
MEMQMERLRIRDALLGLIAWHSAACSSGKATTSEATGSGGNPSFSTGGTLAFDAGDSGDMTDGSGKVDAPEIEGVYKDNYDTDIRITSDTWYIGTDAFHLAVVDNTIDFAIALNDATNPYFSGLWSRFDWTTDANDSLWYCQTSYSAATEQQAIETPRADVQDLSKGCSTYPWSKLTPNP